MRVQVDKIISDNSDIIVCFSSDFGCAKAYWKGKEPSVNSNYQVEVDIDHTLMWGKEVLFEENSKPNIQQKNDQIFVTGCIDSIDEDGYTVLRLDDSIIPFLTIGEPYQVGAHVRLCTKLITLYPVDY